MFILLGFWEFYVDRPQRQDLWDEADYEALEKGQVRDSESAELDGWKAMRFPPAPERRTHIRAKQRLFVFFVFLCAVSQSCSHVEFSSQKSPT